MLKTGTRHVWLAKDYHHHSSAQINAAKELIHKFELVGYEKILDIGCGDGKISAELSNLVPTGSVIGLDIAPEMVAFASNSFSKEAYSNLSFFLGDAQHLNYFEAFDVVFSCFALQWLPEPSLFFRGAYNALKPSGLMAITIPLGVSFPLEESIRRITTLPKWVSYFCDFCPKWHFISDGEYQKLLFEHNLLPIHFATVSQSVLFPSREAFEKYVIQWFSYLNPLPIQLQEEFFNQIIDEYLIINPSLENGEVNFTFSRVDIIASKVIL